MRLRLGTIALATALLASASPAWADMHSEAARLFEDGKKFRDKGELEKAATAFSDSILAEPSIGAYYNLGLINTDLKRWREAVDAYRKAQELARGKADPREKDAAEAITKLRDTHNFVTLKVDDAVSSASGLRIALDGDLVPPAQYNGEVFRQATNHELVVTASGRKEVRLPLPNRQPYVVMLGEPFTTGAPPPPPPPGEEPHSDGWGWQQWTGVGLIGAGLGAVVVGIVFVSDFYSTKKAILDDFTNTCKVPTGTPNPCGTNDKPTSRFDGFRKRADDNAQSSAIRNTVAFSLGGLLIGGGIYLLATAPSSPTKETPPPQAGVIRVVPQIGAHDRGLFVVGTF